MPLDPIRGDDPPTTGRGELVTSERGALDQATGAAAEAVRRMSEEGRSGKVTVSMAVEVQQYPEPAPLSPSQLAERADEQRRFALGMALAVGVLAGLFAASLGFVPDALGGLVGLVGAVWIYGQVKP